MKMDTPELCDVIVVRFRLPLIQASRVVLPRLATLKTVCNLQAAGTLFTEHF